MALETKVLDEVLAGCKMPEDCAHAGIVFKAVNEAYTTQTCSCCGVISCNSPKGRTDPGMTRNVAGLGSGGRPATPDLRWPCLPEALPAR